MNMTNDVTVLENLTLSNDQFYPRVFFNGPKCDLEDVLDSEIFITFTFSDDKAIKELHVAVESIISFETVISAARAPQQPQQKKSNIIDFPLLRPKEQPAPKNDIEDIIRTLEDAGIIVKKLN